MPSKLGRRVDTAVARVWAASFPYVGRPVRPVARWSATGGQRILVVAAHPDDEVAGCGGVILLHQQAGDRVTVAHVTDGRRSRAGGLGPEEMSARRHREAEECMRVLAVDAWEWLGLPEGEWSDQDFAAPLERLVERIAPSVVYAPSRIDFHPEHCAVARVAAAVLKGTRAATVRVYQIHVPLTRVLVNVAAPIATVRERVADATARYASQAGSLRAPWRLRAYAARAHRLPGDAEEFWDLTPAAYAAVHAAPTDRTPLETFRGLRRHSFTDPLAYLRGRGERRRLRAVAEEA